MQDSVNRSGLNNVLDVLSGGSSFNLSARTDFTSVRGHEHKTTQEPGANISFIHAARPGL